MKRVRLLIAIAALSLAVNPINAQDAKNLGLNAITKSAVKGQLEFLASDHTSFAEKDVPVFYFMAGFPPEYHQPGDHLNLINWDKMVNIIKVGYLNIWELANQEWGPEE